MSIPISLSVNGKTVSADVDPRMLLVQFIRDHLRLTGTHVGCDTAQCGACTVHMNGRAIKSCSMLAAQVQGAEITTIEGLSPNGELHPMQAAFKEHHGLQCGFCTPGMVIAGLDIVRRHGAGATRETIAHELEGNLCRCTGYQNIVSAIEAGAKAITNA